MARERAIPCRGSSLQESIRGTHKTWDDDGYCSKCRVLNAQSIAMVRANSSRGTGPGFSSPAVSARVTERRTAGDAGTFDGALQVPSGEQFRSDGVTPSPSEPVSHAGTAHHTSWLSPVLPSGHERHESPQPST